MSDILKSIAQFVDVEPGGSVSSPHGINVKGAPQIPDELTVDNGAFTASADEINVTVTNGGLVVASVGVLCEMWHSIPRVFGKSFQGVQDSLPIRPFVGAGAGSNVVGSDELVKASAADTTPGFLDAKVVAGAGISLATLNPGADEQVEISAPGSTTDEKVKASAADTTPDFLDGKLAAGANVSLAILNPGADEQVEISVAIPVDPDEKVKASAADTTPGFLDAKVVAGAGISLATLNPGADEQVEISAGPGSAKSQGLFSSAHVSTSGGAYVTAYGIGGGVVVPAGGDGDYFAIWEGRVSGSTGSTLAGVALAKNSDSVALANSERDSGGNAATKRTFVTSMLVPGLVAGDRINGLLAIVGGGGSMTLYNRNLTIIKVN